MKKADALFSRAKHSQLYATHHTDELIEFLASSAITELAKFECATDSNQSDDDREQWTLPSLSTALRSSDKFTAASNTGYFNLSNSNRSYDLRQRTHAGWQRSTANRRAKSGSRTPNRLCNVSKSSRHRTARSCAPTHLPSPAHTTQSLRAFFDRCNALCKSIVYVKDYASFVSVISGGQSGECKSEHNRTNLYVVQFDQMKLSACPPIRASEKCNLLSLRHNRITRIDQLHLMTRLVFLDLSNNRLSAISGLLKLESLRVLLLGENRIRRIQGLDQSRHLELLDLHQNQIAQIENLSHLTALKVLNLANNHLVFVNGLSGMVSLTELDLRHNRIIQVERLTNLPKLSWICLSSNKIERWSQISGLANLSSTTQVTLDRNPIVTDPVYRRIIPQAIAMQLGQQSAEDRCWFDDYTLPTMTNTCNTASIPRSRLCALQDHGNSESIEQIPLRSTTEPESSSLLIEGSTHGSTSQLAFITEHNASYPKTKTFAWSMHDSATVYLGGCGDHLVAEIQFVTLDQAVEDFSRQRQGTRAGSVTTWTGIQTLVVTNCTWNEISQHFAKLRSVLPDLKKFVLHNTCLSQPTGLLKLARLAPLASLSIDPSNPLVTAAGPWWRSFVIWTLSGVLNLAELDDKEITSAEVEKAASMFYIFGLTLKENIQLFRVQQHESAYSIETSFQSASELHEQQEPNQLLDSPCSGNQSVTPPTYFLTQQIDQSYLSSDTIEEWLKLLKTIPKIEASQFLMPTTTFIDSYLRNQSALLEEWPSILRKLITEELQF